MSGLIKLNCNNKIELVEFLARLSELVKVTLGGFDLGYSEAKLVSTNNFHFRFASFLPEEYRDVDNVPFEKIIIGERSDKVVEVYKELLNIFFELSEFRMPPTAPPPIGYGKIEKMLKEVDVEIDKLLEL